MAYQRPGAMDKLSAFLTFVLLLIRLLIAEAGDWWRGLWKHKES